MSRVLVTGARGLLGGTLVPHLRAAGYDVLTCSRTTGDFTADLTDGHQVNQVLDQASPEVIVNLAALTDVDECERQPQRAYLSNVRIVEHLASWIRSTANRCHLIQISTDQLYDAVGANREDRVVISNYYGFSKYSGELAAAGVPSTVVRTNFFGRSQVPGRTSLSDWLVDALVQRKPITVFDDLHFSPLSLGRVAGMVEAILERKVAGVFNLGSSGGMSKARFAFALASALGLPTDAVTIGRSDAHRRAARRPGNMCMDSSRFADAFNVTIPTLQDEIMSAAADYETRSISSN